MPVEEATNMEISDTRGVCFSASMSNNRVNTVYTEFYQWHSAEFSESRPTFCLMHAQSRRRSLTIMPCFSFLPTFFHWYQWAKSVVLSLSRFLQIREAFFSILSPLLHCIYAYSPNCIPDMFFFLQQLTCHLHRFANSIEMKKKKKLFFHRVSFFHWWKRVDERVHWYPVNSARTGSTLVTK